MLKNRLLPSVLVLGVLLCPSVLFAQGKGGGNGGGKGGGGSEPSYTIFKLDDPGGLYTASYNEFADMNETGNVVGSVSANPFTAAFWAVDGASSTLMLLGSGDLGDAVVTSARGLNDRDEIVGVGTSIGAPRVALYWAGPDAAPIVLPTLPDGLSCEAYAINNEGIIVGGAQQSSGVWVAVAWRVTPVDGVPLVSGPVTLPNDALPYSRALAVSECDAAGFATVGGILSGSDVGRIGTPDAAARWIIRALADGTLQVMTTGQVLSLTSNTGDLWAPGINASGTVCGFSSFDIYSFPRQAIVWTADAAITLPDPPKISRFYPDLDHHTANDLNDQGAIVGTAGSSAIAGGGTYTVLWPSASSSSPVNLTTLLPNRDAPFIRLSEAIAITNDGVILGRGFDGVGTYGFLAIPE